MKPIKFKEANNMLRKPKGMADEECRPLPIYSDGTVCLSCWKMNLIERLKALFFGKIWVFIRSGKTQPPISLNCWKNAFGKKEQ